VTQDEHNKAALLAAKFVLTKLGVSTDSPLWNWIEQEVQAWITGGYESLLRESIEQGGRDIVYVSKDVLRVARQNTKFTEVKKGIRRRRAMLKAMMHGPGIVRVHWDNPKGATLERVKSVRPKPSGKAARKQKARHIKKVAASRSARRKANRRR
jgi:hypothetical protein